MKEMLNPITSKRLRDAMYEKEINASTLSLKSGVSKASISQYYNGSHKPSTLAADKLADVLDVNPMWLMGFDVPMKLNIQEAYERNAFEEYYDTSFISLYKGKALTHLRNKAMLSLDDLSKMTDLSYERLKELEEKEFPSIQETKALCAALKCSEQDFYYVPEEITFDDIVSEINKMDAKSLNMLQHLITYRLMYLEKDS